jgi:IclR family transcriptional regulator, pca regulon regulatory protein
VVKGDLGMNVRIAHELAEPERSTPMNDSARQNRDRIGGFAKGLQVIEAFGHERPRLTIAEVSRRTGLERATARRYLLTLVGAGYAEFDGKFFTLTPRILRLGYAYLSTTPLPTILQPFLEDVTKATDESSSACVLDGTDIVYIARSAQRRVMSIGLQVGSRLPAYCTSMGRVLLAALPDDAVVERLAQSSISKMTVHTLTDIKSIMAEIANVRERGYSVVDQELELGLRALSVPVYDASGRTVAAMNVGIQAARASASEMVDRFLPPLRQAQAGLRRLIA